MAVLNYERASLLAPDGEEARLATVGLTLIGFGFSAYLTYRELFSIHAVCEWCASSAVILTLLVIASVTRYLLGPGVPEADSAAWTSPRDILPAVQRPRQKA